MKFEPHERKLVSLTSRISFVEAPKSKSFDSKVFFSLYRNAKRRSLKTSAGEEFLPEHKYPRIKGIGTRDEKEKCFSVKAICFTNTFLPNVLECFRKLVNFWKKRLNLIRKSHWWTDHFIKWKLYYYFNNFLCNLRFGTKNEFCSLKFYLLWMEADEVFLDN